MKKNITIALLFLSCFAKGDFWTQKASFPGTGIDYPFSFVIGSMAYVGCGWDNTGTVTNTFWQYDSGLNAWTQKANFGGVPRVAACGFTIGNKGYAGTGADAVFTALQDFWEYDTTANSWTQKANLAGSARYTPVGFAIGGLGYLSTGIGAGFLADMWQYDPVADSWTQKTSLPGQARDDANCFVIGSNAYIVGGCPGFWLADMWEYNTISDSWTQKATLPSTPRCDAAAFAICEKGYFGTGEFGTGYGTDLWQYIPLTNTWSQKTSFPGIGRDEPVGFAIGDKGFIGLGSQDGSAYFYDFWEYTPDSSCSVPAAAFSAPNNICPGTCTGFINLSQGATGYQWTFTGANPNSSTDVNPANICYSTPGNYDVQLIAYNSISSDTLVLNNYITVYPFPSPQGIQQNVDTLFANQGAQSYQWYYNGNIITGATDYFYLANQSGDYNVVCTDLNGCEVEAAIFNVIASVQLLDKNLKAEIYPNPAKKYLKIRGEQFAIRSIDVYNLFGERMNTIIQKETIDVGSLPGGIYLVKVRTENGFEVMKFVKE